MIIFVELSSWPAEVEIRDQPELANKPVAVGGLGMICVLAGASARTSRGVAPVLGRFEET